MALRLAPAALFRPEPSEKLTQLRRLVGGLHGPDAIEKSSMCWGGILSVGDGFGSTCS
jgi:hypothetical protein